MRTAIELHDRVWTQARRVWEPTRAGMTGNGGKHPDRFGSQGLESRHEVMQAGPMDTWISRHTPHAMKVAACAAFETVSGWL